MCRSFSPSLSLSAVSFIFKFEILLFGMCCVVVFPFTLCCVVLSSLISSLSSRALSLSSLSRYLSFSLSSLLPSWRYCCPERVVSSHPPSLLVLRRPPVSSLSLSPFLPSLLPICWRTCCPERVVSCCPLISPPSLSFSFLLFFPFLAERSIERVVDLSRSLSGTRCVALSSLSLAFSLALALSLPVFFP